MTNKFNYNFVNKTIVGSKRSIERANKGLSPEYQELTYMLSQHPDFTVVEKVIQVNESKKTYNKLTLDRMKEYIETQANAEEKIEEFEAIKKVAKARGALYPLSKKWFLATYPEYKTNEISTEQASGLLANAAAALDEIDENETLEKAA